MMKSQLFFICIACLLYSCEAKKLYDYKPIAETILSEVSATSGEITIVEDKLAKSADKKYFIELNVVGSKLVHEWHTEKELVASYCASQLYKRLDQETVDKNYGFNIIFDSENDFTLPNKYFYKKEELVQAWKAFDIIDKYLNYLSVGDMKNASSFIDTSYFYMNVDSINLAIKVLIAKPILKTLNFYEHYKYENRKKTIMMSCFAVASAVALQDGSQKAIDFIIPISELNNKIIMVKPEK